MIFENKWQYNTIIALQLKTIGINDNKMKKNMSIWFYYIIVFSKGCTFYNL